MKEKCIWTLGSYRDGLWLILLRCQLSLYSLCSANRAQALFREAMYSAKTLYFSVSIAAKGDALLAKEIQAKIAKWNL